MLRWMGLPGLIFAFALTGCGATKVTRTVQRPGEIDLSGRKTIVLQAMQYPDGERLNARLKERLADKGFTIVERGADLSSIRQNELVEKVKKDFESFGPGLQQARAAIMIRTRILVKDTRSIVESEQRSEGEKKKKGYREWTVYRAVGRSNLEVGFDVIDLESTTVIASRAIRSTQTDQTAFSENRRPVYDDLWKLEDAAFNDVVVQFMRKIAGYSDSVDVTLLDVGGNKDCETGIKLMQAGQYAQAQSLFQRAMGGGLKDDDRAKLLNNSAAALECAGDLDGALENYRKAYELRSEQVYLDGINRCSQLKAERGKLVK